MGVASELNLALRSGSFRVPDPDRAVSRACRNQRPGSIPGNSAVAVLSSARKRGLTQVLHRRTCVKQLLGREGQYSSAT